MASVVGNSSGFGNEPTAADYVKAAFSPPFYLGYI